MRNGSISLAAALLLLSTVSPAETQAAHCGDDVGGRRVACSCGDIVVSDLRLERGDPVVAGRCALDGIVVRAAPTRESIHVDLAGLSIVGRGYGTGIRVESGGADGAVIVGSTNGRRAEIVGFGTGVVTAHSRALARIEALVVKGNRHRGLSLRGAGLLVFDVTASDNGGDGIVFSGSGGRIEDVEVLGNGRAGIRLQSRGTVVAATSNGNAEHGIVADGALNDLSGTTTVLNGGHGLVVRGGFHGTAGALSYGNDGNDVRKAGASSR